MTSRLAIFVCVAAGILIASSAVPRSAAPGGPSAGSQSDRMTLAAASAEFLACKDKCYKDDDCEARYGLRVPGVPNPALSACTDKRRACVQACPK